MKYYIIFGPPGAGKGTHAAEIVEAFNLKHISTGELLRAEIAAETPLGKKAQELINAGSLVPDEVVEGMIAGVFESNKDVNGFLLDGFPRTIEQAKALDKMLCDRGGEVTAVISLMIPDEMIIERISERARIENRADDADVNVIRHRIDTYHEKTEPLIGYYTSAGKYHEISSIGTIPEVRERLIAAIKKI